MWKKNKSGKWKRNREQETSREKRNYENHFVIYSRNFHNFAATNWRHFSYLLMNLLALKLRRECIVAVACCISPYIGKCSSGHRSAAAAAVCLFIYFLQTKMFQNWNYVGCFVCQFNEWIRVQMQINGAQASSDSTYKWRLCYQSNVCNNFSFDFYINEIVNQRRIISWSKPTSRWISWWLCCCCCNAVLAKIDGVESAKSTT